MVDDVAEVGDIVLLDELCFWNLAFYHIRPESQCGSHDESFSCKVRERYGLLFGKVMAFGQEDLQMFFKKFPGIKTLVRPVFRGDDDLRLIMLQIRKKPVVFLAKISRHFCFGRHLIEKLRQMPQGC